MAMSGSTIISSAGRLQRGMMGERVPFNGNFDPGVPRGGIAGFAGKSLTGEGFESVSFRDIYHCDAPLLRREHETLGHR